jgi:uncharacterized protein
MSKAEPAVTDDRKGERFVLTRDKHKAELAYEVDHANLLLLHTEVPEAFRGQGVGGRLVEAAVARARTDNLTVVPWCPYARRWLQEHSEASTGVAIDFETLPP